MSTTLGQLRVRLLKHPIGAGVDRVLLDGAINDAIQEILERHDWQRLIVEGSLQTVAIYDTGTLALTNGLNTVSITGGTFTAAMTGRKIRPTGRNENYTFTYASASTGTLDRVYEGDTDTAASFRMFQNVFELAANCDYVESLRHPSSIKDLDQVGREWLDNRDPARLIFGDPRYFTSFQDSDDATPLTQIELHPIPEAAKGMPVRYRVKVVKLSATTDKLPEWMSERAVFRGALMNLAELSGADIAALKVQFEGAISDLIRKDVLATETQAIEMHERYTRHRAARALGDDDNADLIFDLWNSEG
jgi:hypothetical protein